MTRRSIAIFFFLSLFAVILLTAGCGKYGPPLVPEQLAPAHVKDLEGRLDGTKVVMNWHAPEEDLRGKELRTMNGYRIYRSEVSVGLAVGAEPVEPTLLATLPDDHVLLRDKMREDARASGKIGRRVAVPDEKLKFEYVDESAPQGKIYDYLIVPVNQDDVEGQVTRAVRYDARGTSSTISVIDRSDDLEDASLTAAK